MSKDAILARVQAEPSTWTELIAVTGLSKATLYQHLQELQERNLIAKDPNDKYIPTEKGSRTLELHRKQETTTQIETFEGVTKETVKAQIQRIATCAFYLKTDLGFAPLPGLPLRRENEFYLKHQEEAAKLDELLSYFVRLAPKLGFKTKAGRLKKAGYYDWANALIDRDVWKGLAQKFGRPEVYDSLETAGNTMREDILGELIKRLRRDVESFPTVPDLDVFVAYMKSLVKEIDLAYEKASIREELK